MLDLDKWQEIRTTLGANKLRTVLTALGVFWGIFMLLLMTGFGDSMQTGVRKQMAGLATNSVFLWGQKTTMPYEGLQPGRYVGFDNRDIEGLRRIDGIEHLAPRNQLGGFRGGFNVSYGGKTGSFQVMADFPQFQYINTPKYVAGRYINNGDIVERRKICVIGTGVVEQIYPPGVDPIGTYIKASGVYFQVVGVTGSLRGGQEGERDASSISVPFTTYQQAFNAGDQVGWFSLTVRADVKASEVEAKARAILAHNHKVSPDDKMAIGSFNAQEAFSKMADLFWAINTIMWVVGTMTLAAGVIGVSNIMLISVKERTKEIGVRKALGATPWSVITMVLSEAIVLTAAAGYAGLVCGIALLAGAGAVLENAPPTMPFGPPHVGLDLGIIATIVLIVAGAIAGLMPAIHAASIQPVVALRDE